MSTVHPHLDMVSDVAAGLQGDGLAGGGGGVLVDGYSRYCRYPNISIIYTLPAPIMVWLMAPSSSQESSLMWDTHSRNSLGPCRCRYAVMQICGYLKA